MGMHARLRNCLGRTHVSWRPYSRRSCCQDRRRSILRRRITRRNTTQLEKSASGPLQVHLGLDMELWYPPGLSASNCSPSVFQQARNGRPSKVLYWRVQSSTSTTGHCRRRSPVLREDQLVWWNSPPFTVLSQPFPHSTASPSPAPMINCGSSRWCCQNSKNWCYPVCNPY